MLIKFVSGIVSVSLVACVSLLWSLNTNTVILKEGVSQLTRTQDKISNTLDDVEKLVHKNDKRLVRIESQTKQIED